MNRRLYFALLAAALLVAAGPARAQDRDRDGLPDDVEARLGTNPGLDEGLQVVLDDKTRDRGDATVGGSPGAPDVDQVLAAHVAGGRFVWKITFAQPYPERGAVLHLYVDLDDDLTNGRQDTDWVRGVDAMYTFTDSRLQLRLITPAVRPDPEIPPRGVVQGNSVYVCDDVKLKAAAGRTRFRLRVLSQVRERPADSDSSEWVTVAVPLHEERPMPELSFPRQQNFERISLPDFAQLTYGLWQEARNLRLRPKDATVAGYGVLMNEDLDGKGEAGESVAWRNPRAGDYRVGLILRDDAAQREALDVFVAGKKVGTVVGESAATREVLHFTREPLRLRQGDAIEVRGVADAGPLRFHSVCLLAEKPQVARLAIENLTAWHFPDEPGERPGRILIAWTTNRPADGTVKYSLAGPEAVQQNGTLEEGRGAVNSHFLLLPPELSATGYRLEITSREPEQADHLAQTATASDTVWCDPAQHRRQHGTKPAADPEVVRIALSVFEPARQGRDAWPVTSGVPLPDGALTDFSRCRLVDASGKVVPAQFRALARWPNTYTVKWLQVDFLARTTAGKAAAYTLECNAAPVQVPSPLVVRSRGEDVRSFGVDPNAPRGAVPLPVAVETGRLSLQIGAGGFAPFASARLDGQLVSAGAAARAGFEITDQTGTVYSTANAAPEQVLVEDAGRVRATVCVRGRFAAADGRGFMRYLCRLHFWAGQPYVRIAFTLENDVAQPNMARVRNLRVRVPAEMSGAILTTGAEAEEIHPKLGERLLQDEDNHFTVGGREGKRADGWLFAARPDRRLAVAIRDFWQLYPKALSADGEGMVVDLLPELPETQYSGASEDDRTKLYFWCDQGHYKLRTGVRLTTEFTVDYAPAVEASGAWASGEWWQQPLFAACSPEWYCASGAFGPMAPRAPGKFTAYEKALDAAFEKFLTRRETVREYGFMNYGDWFGERTWNWGNIEYDTQWALAANFARTGNLAMLWRAEQAERHNADVDTIHAAGNPSEVGRVYTHCVGHTGGYFPDDWKGMGNFNRGPRDTGHTWAQGHFALYALTGERRFLETGRKVADWVVDNTTDFRYRSERNAGWPLIAVMGAHSVTGSPVYLNAARLIADTVMWTQHPERGGWGHFIDPNECKHRPQCWGCKPFMTGVLLHGLKLYDLAQPREEIRRTLRRNCDFLWRETYVRADKGFAYSECQTFIPRGQKWTVSLVGDGLAYGCLLDPEHKNRELLREATAFYFEQGVSDFGKGFTQGTCFVPLMLHDLDALGVLNDGAGAP